MKRDREAWLGLDDRRGRYCGGIAGIRHFCVDAGVVDVW